jgi:hypothetical protein
MITIWKKTEAGFELIEEYSSGYISGLSARLSELRQDGNEYRAEQKNDCFSLVFDL